MRSPKLYLASGRALWLALLALTLGTAWTLGHFQIQAWTLGLVILTALWRSAVDRLPWKRAAALIATTLWGSAIAAVQLGPSWQFADSVGQMRRSSSELLYYSFPPVNWFDLVLPQLIRELKRGPVDPYWAGLQTEGFEVAFYVGSVPLFLAFVALVAQPRSRPTLPWKLMIPICFALATLPQWWTFGYLRLIDVPGVGYFRVPARYTLFCSLGLALLAGEGLDLTISRARFRLGLAAAIVFAMLALVAGVLWTMRSDVHLRLGLFGSPDGFLWFALGWSCALASLLAWRAGRIGAWWLLVVSAIELALLFYHGTTDWGPAIELPGQSPVLTEIARRSPQALVGGETGNLPVLLGFKTAHPYLGFAHAPFNRLLCRLQDLPLSAGKPMKMRGLAASPESS